MSPLDQLLLHTYLDGQMDEATEEAFELRMLEDRELAEAVEASVALAIGLGRSDEHATQVPTSDSKPTASTIARAPNRPSERVRFLLAAGVFLALGLGAGQLLHLKDSTSLAPASLVYIDALRGDPNPPTVKLPEAGNVVLAVPLLDASCAPTLTIVQEGTSMHSDAAPSPSGYASVVLDSEILRTGAATVLLECENREVARYPTVFTR